MAVSGSLGPSVEELISTNTVNTGSIHLVGNVTASHFSGSFIGNGSGLYNIPSSGVTGLELNKIVSGSVSASISPNRGLEVNTNTTIHGDLIVSNSLSIGTSINDKINIKALISSSLVPDSDAIHHFIGGPAKRWENVYSRTGSFNHLEGISGSTVNISNAIVSGSFTGSYIGDGGGLYNIPASGVTGLNLTRIADGNATASISNAHGLKINTNTEITGSLIVSSGSAVFDASLQLTENSSLILNSGSNLYVYDGGIISGTFKGNGHLLTDLPYATTASNHFLGDQIITGSVTITQNLIVLGSSSISYVTSSQLNVATSFISVNVFEPAERFGGLKVYDSGSANGTASLAWDSLHNHWIYQNVTGSQYSGGMLLSGPLNSGSLGDEPNLISGRILKSVGDSHVDVSIISETGNTISVNGHLVADSLTGSIDFNNLTNKPALVSGSSQIIYSGLTGIPSDIVSGSSQIELTGTTGYSTLSSSINSINSFTSSYSTGSFTGSFKGDGSHLYNIPATGVTGLQLDKIVSGNASASIDANGFYVNKNVYIDGTITAKELYIDYVTSSVLFQSGSTKFGDSADDNHNFTGSVYIDGNLNVDSITGSIDFNNLTNVPTLVSGSSQISYTGITNIPNGIVSGSGQVINLGFTTTSSFEGFTSSYTTHSSSFDTRINTITGSFNSYTSSTDTHLTSLDNFTSSVVLTTQTSSMTVLSSSYALTAAFALNAGAGGSGGGSGGGFAELNQTTPSTTWTFQHNLGQKYPIFQIFDSNDKVIIPSQIIAVSSDSATITFPSTQTGRAIASLGTGPGGMTQQFSAATTWSVSHNMGADYPIVTVYNNNRKIIFPDEIRSIDADNVEVYFSAPVAGYLNVAKGGHIISGSIDISNINLTGSNVISGSSQISNLGYATTGSNTFNGSQTINGCLTINNAKICATGTTISANTQIFNLSSFDGAFFDYVVKSGINMRAGTIMSAWNGTNATFNEATTIDLGNTSAVGFNVSATGVLNATISSGTWTVEVLYRALGSGIINPTPTATAGPFPTSTPTPTPTVGNGTNYLISMGFSAPNYCNGLYGNNQTVYGDSPDWLQVTRFYTNSGMTTPFNGNSLYYGDSNASYGTTLQINSSGYVINSYAC
jgi:hypothetical protein